MGKLKDSYWPDITTLAIAAKCVKNAAGIAYWVAGLTALLSLLSWFDVFHLVSPWAFLDAALFAVIGFFIARGSRVAAILGLTLYLFEAVERLVSGGGSSGGTSVVAIFFTLFFINGVRGAFAQVQLRRASESIGLN